MTELRTTTGVKRVLLVDDDEGTRILITNYLQHYGESHWGDEPAPELVTAVDGQEAWEHVKNGRFDLIFLDWKLPRLSGLALFNRLRSDKRHQSTPVLVVSGFVDKVDFRLLQEFPCTSLMEKPFTKALFESRLEELFREADWYGQNVALVDAILRAARHDVKQCESLIKDVLKTAPNPVPLALIAAKRLARAKMNAAAAKILKAVLAVDDGCIIAMNELGKLLHAGGQHRAALDVLRQANKLSPQNLKRLCLMGDVELNLGEPENAKAYFEQALAIDQSVKTAQAGVVIADNMSERLADADLGRGAPLELHPDGAGPGERLPGAFASLMNTIGIALVRNGQFGRGIEQYAAALSFLPSRTERARVAFNLGLGYLRWGKSDDALPWFQKSTELGGAEFDKSAQYVRRLLSAGKSVPAEAMEEMASPAEGAGDQVEANFGGSNVIPFPGQAPQVTPPSEDDGPDGMDDAPAAAAAAPVGVAIAANGKVVEGQSDDLQPTDANDVVAL